MILAFLALAATGAGADRPPVILMPGLTGSALDARLSGAQMPHFECKTDTHGKWRNIWLAPTQLLPREKDCLLRTLTLTYDAATDSYSNLPGVEIRAHQDMDLLYKYEFGPMIDRLSTSLNYSLGTDLFIAAYDWRLAGDSHAHATNGVGGFYAELKVLIEQSVQKTGSPAVLLSHSLGCPTALYFFHSYVSEAWRATYMKGWIAVSGPWLGSTMQVNAYLGGWNLDEPSWMLPHDYVKPVQVNASSGVWLSPSAMAFGDAAIVTTPSRNYTANDVQSLISLIGEQAGGEQTLHLHKKLSGLLPSVQKPPINVPMHNWYSTGVKTSERYEYSTEITKGFDQAPDKVHHGDGDGIVNHISAKVIETLWPKDPQHPVITQVFPGASHFGMLSDGRVLDQLVKYLNPSKASVDSNPSNQPMLNVVV